MHQAKHIPIVNNRLRRSLLFLAAVLLLILVVSLTTQGESDSPPTNLLVRDLHIFDGAPAISRGDVGIQNGRIDAVALGMWAKGGARAYYVMILTQSGGVIPAPDRMKASLPVSRFGVDGQDDTAIFISLPGHFSLLIDRLQFQNKPGWKDKSECESEEL